MAMPPSDFDVLYVVDQHGDAALDVGGDALLHLLRLKSGVSPDQPDDRNINFRENVGWRAHQDQRRQKHDDERHHDKGIRSGEC
jgi:hypothetical protein